VLRLAQAAAAQAAYNFVGGSAPRCGTAASRHFSALAQAPPAFGMLSVACCVLHRSSSMELNHALLLPTQSLTSTGCWFRAAKRCPRPSGEAMRAAVAAHSHYCMPLPLIPAVALELSHSLTAYPQRAGPAVLPRRPAAAVPAGLPDQRRRRHGAVQGAPAERVAGRACAGVAGAAAAAGAAGRRPCRLLCFLFSGAAAAVLACLYSLPGTALSPLCQRRWCSPTRRSAHWQRGTPTSRCWWRGGARWGCMG
jgi:hypothetical protein